MKKQHTCKKNKNIKMASGNSIVLTAMIFIYCLSGYLKADELEEVCFDYLGCFKTDPAFYDPILRPFNPLPENPKTINTSFFLFTRQNPKIPQLISYSDRQSIAKSHFCGFKSVKIICHGFASSANTKWIQRMKKKILEKENVNVIVVNWAEGALGSYPQVCANIRVVGRQLGLLLKMLQDSFRFDLKNGHIIGHSLGAHVAGYAGEYLKNQLGRISGLDPARPSFEYMPPTVRLDPSDAKFVDVIHTTGTNFFYLGVGLLQAIGHVDIYVDGGDTTRSCEAGNILETVLSQGPLGIYNTIVCNHHVAHDIFIESIRQQCPYLAYACDDLRNYKMGQCAVCKKPGRDCIPMGYYADQYHYNGDLNHKFYISISDQPHETCLYHWLVSIVTSTDPLPQTSVKLYVNIKADGGYFHNLRLGDKAYEFTSNRIYNFLLEVNQKIGEIEEIEFWLERKTGWKFNYNYNPEDCRDDAEDRFKFKELIFIPIDFIDNREREKLTAKFCSESLKCGIPPNVTILLESVNIC